MEGYFHFCSPHQLLLLTSLATPPTGFLFLLPRAGPSSSAWWRYHPNCALNATSCSSIFARSVSQVLGDSNFKFARPRPNTCRKPLHKNAEYKTGTRPKG